LETSSISSLATIHASLRTAFESAVRYGNTDIQAPISAALDHVRIEMGKTAQPPGNASQGLSAGGTTATISDLGEVIAAALMLAETLGQDHAALILNDALIHVTGKGISPPDWPPA